jgi:hypothetical protein
VHAFVRVCRFYHVADVRVAVERWVKEINDDPTIIENPSIRGPHSKYTLPEEGNELVLYESQFMFYYFVSHCDCELVCCCVDYVS